MAESPDDLEKLLTDVRKTIHDNQLFLDKLLDEAVETDTDGEDEEEEEAEGVVAEDDFEEL